FPTAQGFSGHRLFISAFMLASKVICDDTPFPLLRDPQVTVFSYPCSCSHPRSSVTTLTPSPLLRDLHVTVFSYLLSCSHPRSSVTTLTPSPPLR
ncbi:uncharacterized protein EDB93DRAFT_1081551, partial [Suillus bovinus]|uniref:uncharacterized protein n=1 Tax=Suillus bovinus TaxID=48563 RepID=UPI001B876D54